MTQIRFLATFCCLFALACSGNGGGTPTSPSVAVQPSTSPVPPPTTPIPSQPVTVTLIGAGDIGQCHPESALTAERLAGADIVFAPGDLSNVQGHTAQTYRDCYDPAWGKFDSILKPSPGNHDYDEPGAYQQRFGFPYYYSYDAGAWHIVALDSNGSTAYIDQQVTWLRADLEANAGKCVMAYWHHPLFTTPGPNNAEPKTKRFWNALYQANTRIVVNGHNHWYERFLPQDPDGKVDNERGIRQFTVGTGGASLYEPSGSRATNSEVLASVHGVIKLRLSADKFEWQFVSVAGRSFSDSGSGSCR